MRPESINPLTLEEHRQLGAEIKTSIARMSLLCEMVVNVYGAHSLPAFHFVKAVEALGQLTTSLEHQATQDLKGIGIRGIYR